MSISVAGSSVASQMLASIVSQLSGSASTSGGASATSTEDPTTVSAVGTGDSGNALTGSSKPSLSSEVMDVLMKMMQMDESSGASSSSSLGISSLTMSSLTMSSLSMSSVALSSTSPLQQLFAAMDTDGDSSENGTDSTVAGIGGTQSPGDSLSSLASTDFAQAWENFQGSDSGASQGSLMASMLDTLSKMQGSAAAGASTGGITA